jgi:hypothetical protein
MVSTRDTHILSYLWMGKLAIWAGHGYCHDRHKWLPQKSKCLEFAPVPSLNSIPFVWTHLAFCLILWFCDPFASLFRSDDTTTSQAQSSAYLLVLATYGVLETCTPHAIPGLENHMPNGSAVPLTVLDIWAFQNRWSQLLCLLVLPLLSEDAAHAWKFYKVNPNRSNFYK